MKTGAKQTIMTSRKLDMSFSMRVNQVIHCIIPLYENDLKLFYKPGEDEPELPESWIIMYS
jgi:hypothetical protein